jgi:SAM-dependent methyltransferase
MLKVRDRLQRAINRCGYTLLKNATLQSLLVERGRTEAEIPFHHLDFHSSYYDQRGIGERVSQGEHRELIGGLWDEVGSLQFEFLRANGLCPETRLLDIGCGSLRLGVRAVDYLKAGNYWGTDINESLLRAGYEKEIMPSGLAHKLPRDHLVVDGEFTFATLPRNFDFAIAQSVFTHLPLNYMRLCLDSLAAHIDGPCTFFLTVFIAPDDMVSRPVSHHPGGVVTFPHRDPYHCTQADLHHIARGGHWSVEFMGDWNHPRDQKMVVFRKT